MAAADIFDRLDANRDGVVTREEWQRAMAPQATQASSANCPACGNVYLDDAAFCRKCGRKRDEAGAGKMASSGSAGAFAVVGAQGGPTMMPTPQVTAMSQPGVMTYPSSVPGMKDFVVVRPPVPMQAVPLAPPVAPPVYMQGGAPIRPPAMGVGMPMGAQPLGPMGQPMMAVPAGQPVGSVGSVAMGPAMSSAMGPAMGPAMRPAMGPAMTMGPPAMGAMGPPMMGPPMMGQPMMAQPMMGPPMGPTMMQPMGLAGQPMAMQAGAGGARGVSPARAAVSPARGVSPGRSAVPVYASGGMNPGLQAGTVINGLRSAAGRDGGSPMRSAVYSTASGYTPRMQDLPRHQGEHRVIGERRITREELAETGNLVEVEGSVVPSNERPSALLTRSVPQVTRVPDPFLPGREVQMAKAR
ncbi:unnamed protein product [Symbiodinium natans]|uniref:EF-hand domain-containing protein n=1 Tax=Symbiodinium natans TaxID=878477 RepID=A0A812TY59_9DINO|nr:unnamed protein product [Symbiodinium natans]